VEGSCNLCSPVVVANQAPTPNNNPSSANLLLPF
jgi:hypothetical protein